MIAHVLFSSGPVCLRVKFRHNPSLSYFLNLSMIFSTTLVVTLSKWHVVWVAFPINSYIICFH